MNLHTQFFILFTHLQLLQAKAIAKLRKVDLTFNYIYNIIIFKEMSALNLKCIYLYTLYIFYLLFIFIDRRSTTGGALGFYSKQVH